VHLAALQALDQLREPPGVLRQRPAVNRNFDHRGAARLERAVELDIDRAVALHQDARALQREIVDCRQDFPRGERLGRASIDAHAARAQRPDGLRAAHRDRHGPQE
jgi:hypothetical protein